MLPAVAITFVCMSGYTALDRQGQICSKCHIVLLYNVNAGCLPVHLQRLEVWYDKEVPALTFTEQLSGPTAAQSHRPALTQLYSCRQKSAYSNGTASAETLE